MSVFVSGPIPAYSNPPVQPQFYQPSLFPITDIERGVTTTVTMGTSFGVSNNYVIGQLVRFMIPPTYGIRQLNGQQGYVIGIPSEDQVIVDIDTSINYDNFIADPSYGPTPPQIAAIGDINSGPINASGRTNITTYIQGSFLNISPQ